MSGVKESWSSSAKLTLHAFAVPTTTYILHPPSKLHPSVEALFAKETTGSSSSSNGDEPHRLCERLYSLGKGDVCLVKPDPDHVGLRVAVAGGRWDASRWASGEDAQSQVRTM